MSCNLSKVDLRQANLSGGNLLGSILTDVQIEGVDFTQTKLSDEQRGFLISIASGVNESTGRETLQTLREHDQQKHKKLFGLF